MTNTTHTPGTWKVDGDRDSYTQELRIVQESTGEVIAVIYPTLGFAEADIANARLIAAAPRLLRFLQRWLSTQPGDTYKGYRSDQDLNAEAQALYATATPHEEA